MPEEHDEAQRMFNMVDTDFSGSICLDELRAYMRQENPSVKDAQVRDFFEEMDVDGSGKNSFIFLYVPATKANRDVNSYFLSV